MHPKYQITPRCTLRTVAKELNLSTERVRQIERAALDKLRRICEANNLTFEDMAPAERESRKDFDLDT